MVCYKNLGGFVKIRVLICAAFISFFSSSVMATLVGDEIIATWSYPPNSWSETLLVGDGIEMDGYWGGSNTLDIGATSISVTFNEMFGGLAQGVSWTFSDLDFSTGDLVNAIVSTNLVGWDDSFLSYGNDYVNVSFLEGVTYTPGEGYFDIELTAVPVPASAWLFSTALLALVVFRKRHKPTAQAGFL